MGNVQKVTISVNCELLEKIDAYADDNGMTRSGFIGLAAKQYLQSVEMLPNVAKIFSEIASFVEDKAGMSEEQKVEQIRLFDDDINAILGKKS